MLTIFTAVKIETDVLILWLIKIILHFKRKNKEKNVFEKMYAFYAYKRHMA